MTASARRRLALFASLALAAVCLIRVQAQGAPPAGHGTVDVITVHGASLEGNLEGDSPDRQVSVYLPPSYRADAARRYPVLYLLHGYTDTDDRWFGRVRHFINVPVLAGRAMAAGQSAEMIVVMPNAYTRYQGSMYSSSLVTGDWEQFIARDLVAAVDSRYRTIADRSARGLAGHSMGGYGTLRIGMKHPAVFSSLYALSPCCLSYDLALPSASVQADIEAIRTIEEFQKAPFGIKAQFASAAAWSPNPDNPPFYFDLPFRHGALQPLVAAKWAANSPLAMVEQYLSALNAMKAVAFDAGDRDTRIADTIRSLDDILSSSAVRHVFEIYDGDHVSGVALRFETKVLPFFTATLSRGL